MNKIDFEKLFVGFDNLCNSPHFANTAGLPEYPRYNILKTENGYQVQVATPGWNKEQIEVKLFKNNLTIKGTKKSDTESNWIHKGISGKSFEKSFRLDAGLEVASGAMENGMLYVNLEYSPASKPKVIPLTGTII